jgi:hypothetical protein
MNMNEYKDYLAMREQAIKVAGGLYTLADVYGALLTREEWRIVREMGELSIKLMSNINRELDE